MENNLAGEEITGDGVGAGMLEAGIFHRVHPAAVYFIRGQAEGDGADFAPEGDFHPPIADHRHF